MAHLTLRDARICAVAVQEAVARCQAPAKATACDGARNPTKKKPLPIVSVAHVRSKLKKSEGVANNKELMSILLGSGLFRILGSSRGSHRAKLVQRRFLQISPLQAFDDVIKLHRPARSELRPEVANATLEHQPPWAQETRKRKRVQVQGEATPVEGFRGKGEGKEMQKKRRSKKRRVQHRETESWGHDESIAAVLAQHPELQTCQAGVTQRGAVQHAPGDAAAVQDGPHNCTWHAAIGPWALVGPHGELPKDHGTGQPQGASARIREQWFKSHQQGRQRQVPDSGVQELILMQQLLAAAAAAPARGCCRCTAAACFSAARPAAGHRA